MAPSTFKPRPHKQKAKAAAAALQSSLSTVNTQDPNAAEHLPASRSERDEKRAKLRADLAAHREATSKTNSKKRKRLDKYIETKLRKDETASLIKKLADQQVDTSLFRSAKKLGRRTEDRKEAAGRALRERRAGIGGGALDDEVLFQRVRQPAKGDLGHSSSTSDGENSGSSDQHEDIKIENITDGYVPPKPFGTGLKSPLELDEAGNPIIRIRERKKRKMTVSAIPQAATSPNDDWEGFSAESGDDTETSDQDLLDDMSEVSTEDTDGTRSSESGAEEMSEESDATSDDEATDEELDEAEQRRVQQEVLKGRASAFTAWASQQRNDAAGFTPSNVDLMRTREKDTPDTHPSYVNHVTTKPGLPQVHVPKTKNVFNVNVNRSDEVQEARARLPVVAEEQKIMEAIRSNTTTIIWGATGSGKTTQIPQFLYEAGFGDASSPTPGIIGVTQPRRVAAVSMAKRVATELGNASGKVSHQIRFDSTVSAKTAIKFMTDGVLLREISQDFTLSKYSAVVIDEAHERSVNTDILIGMLSRIVDTRAELAKSSEKYYPLKLIIMSATLRIADFTKNTSLFRQGAPPIVQAEGRQFPVTIHFARKTQRGYVEEVFHKVSRAHRKLPPGGILVFLTGQGEITHLSKMLKKAIASTTEGDEKSSIVRVSAANTMIEDGDMELEARLQGNDSKHGGLAELSNDDDENDDYNDSENDNEDDEFYIEGEESSEASKIHVLPLYSQLPTEQQMRVFDPSPNGSRMIVLATNVAETSLTIPGIRYVFDCGRAKEKRFDRATGVQSFDIGWISKASASQRSGRAGRTGPGHCYRLYSSAVFERDFVEFAEPEIRRTPIEGVVLQLKSMGIPKVTNFPFPTPPDRQSLVKAERLLEYMGALFNGRVTAVGQELSTYPLSPRLSRILVMGRMYGCLEYAIALVAALAVQEIFVTESHLDLREPEDTGIRSEEQNMETAAREQRRKEYNTFHGNAARLDRSSDAIKMLVIMLDFLQDQNWGPTSGDFRRFTRVKALQEAVQLRSQLSTIVTWSRPGQAPLTKSPTLPEPTSKQVKALRQIVAAGYIDQVAIRADLSPTPPDMARKPRRATDVPYLTLFPSHDVREDSEARQSADVQARAKAQQAQMVFVHPSSVLAHVGVEKMPQYLIYSHLSRTTPSAVLSSKVTKTRLHPLTPLSAQQIVALAEGTPLVEEGKPVGKIEMLERDAEDGCERRMCWTTPFLRSDIGSGGGSMGWPLPPARRVIQKRVKSKGWVYDKLADSQ